MKQFSRENLRILYQAVKNEPPSMILQNIKKLLQNSSKESIDNVKRRIETFISGIEADDREVMIFTSHEASRTGAPLIILELAKHIRQHYNVQPVILLCNDGELLSEFQSVGPCYELHYYFNKTILNEEMNYLVSRLTERKINVSKAYVNSVESTGLLKYLQKLPDTKIISLIHELGHYYKKDSWSHVPKYSDIVVFPSELVKTRANQNTSFASTEVKVLGQGLLKEELLKPSIKSERADFRISLDVPEDSILVLGCGSLILRKGIDIFILSAISFLNKWKSDVPVHFIWIGHENKNDYLLWNKRDIEDSGYTDNIHLLGPQSDTIPYFINADVFFLSSRGDPFPCVVHEAMAAKLPILAFNDASGWSEIIDDDLGKVVEYGDIYQSSIALEEIITKLGKQEYYRDSSKVKSLLDNDTYCSELYKLNN